MTEGSFPLKIQEQLVLHPAQGILGNLELDPAKLKVPMRAFDVVSGCLWPSCHHLTHLLTGSQTPLSPSLLSLTFSFYPAVSSHRPAPGPLSGPAPALSHFWCLPPQSQSVTSMKCSLGEMGDYRKLSGCSLHTEETVISYTFSPGLYFFALTMPVSTTYFIPVMVMEVSAMLVEMITLR